MMDAEEKLVSLTFGDQISITTTDNEGFLALGQNDVPCVKLERWHNYVEFISFFFCFPKGITFLLQFPG